MEKSFFWKDSDKINKRFVQKIKSTKESFMTPTWDFVDEVSQAILLLFTEKFQQGYMSQTLNKDRQPLVERILPDQDT